MFPEPCSSGSVISFPCVIWTHNELCCQQVAPADGQTLQCELGSHNRSRQMEVFTKAQTSFNRYRPELYICKHIQTWGRFHLCVGSKTEGPDASVLQSLIRKYVIVLSALLPAAGLSVSDQDSGVEDEDLSPRPSPSPHAPAQQVSVLCNHYEGI